MAGPQDQPVSFIHLQRLTKETTVSDVLKNSVGRVEKPWGYGLWWARTDRYVGKILHATAATP